MENGGKPKQKRIAIFPHFFIKNEFFDTKINISFSKKDGDCHISVLFYLFCTKKRIKIFQLRRRNFQKLLKTLFGGGIIYTSGDKWEKMSQNVLKW